MSEGEGGREARGCTAFLPSLDQLGEDKVQKPDMRMELSARAQSSSKTCGVSFAN